ncbi:MAG: CpaD family pilus assembly lipoprotein [Geminicoccaceae bacterium]
MFWLLGLLPALQACAPLEPLPPARTLPTPAVIAVEYRHVVNFQADQSDISSSEAAALGKFIATLPDGQVRTARISGHADDRSDDVHNADLSARRTARVAEMLRSFYATELELAILPVTKRSYLDQRPNERAWSRNRHVEVYIAGVEVVLPGCPDWSGDPGYDPGNFPLTNLGCANAYNLGMMAADSNDLAYPRSLAPGDGTHEAEAITRYRADKVKDLRADIIH